VPGAVLQARPGQGFVAEQTVTVFAPDHRT